MAETPKLVVMSGYSGSGKSTVAAYLQKELGFERLSSDKYREMLFGVDLVELMKDPEFQVKEWELLWPMLDKNKYHMLGKGRNVVIDSTASFNGLRLALLDTRYDGREMEAEKYLAVIRADRTLLVERGRRSDLLDTWKWEEPEEQPVGYQVLTYTNNIPEELEAIKRDMNARFRKKGELYIPQ